MQARSSPASTPNRRAGKVSIDANLGGTSTCWAMSARGQIESMNGKLIDPDVLQPAMWRSGKPKLNDPGPSPDLPADFRCSFQSAEWVMTDLFANTSIVKPGEITSWKDLLKPQYKGKIAAFDPRRSGPGQTPVGYLAALFGHDYLKELYHRAAGEAHRRQPATRGMGGARRIPDRDRAGAVCRRDLSQAGIAGRARLFRTTARARSPAGSASRC